MLTINSNIIINRNAYQNNKNLNYVQKNNTNTPRYSNSYFDVCNFKNNLIQFTGKENNLPASLKVSNITDYSLLCETGRYTDKLSGVLSTALKYLSEDCPLILGGADREFSRRFLDGVCYNGLLDDALEWNNILFVEDGRIQDNPIMIVKNNDGYGIIGDVELLDKDSGEIHTLTNSMITPLNPKKNGIIMPKLGLDTISIGEVPDKSDIKYIKKFDVVEFFSEEFEEVDEPYENNCVVKDYEKVPKTKCCGTYPMFSDIGGNKEAIQKIIENIYAPMVFPEIFGHRMTKASILEGPPGTGKSMLGHALCNELAKKLGEKVSLFKISGAEMQVSAVGGSEAKWRDLFKDAKDNQPSLILIDEIDACTPKRDGSSNARYDNSVVNQLLSLMSELEKSDDKTYVIGMTNRLNSIDPAMIRNGRFGNIISVPAPNLEETREIFDIVSKKYNLKDNIDLDKLMKKFVSIKATGATISGILENAEKYAYRKQDVYSKLLTDSISADEIKAIQIETDDIYKAITEEEKKFKKSERTVIKGFRS